MTVATLNTSSGPYTGTGATDQEFPVTFQSAGDDEIKVWVDGVETDPSEWTFNRNADGTGTVVATLDGTVYITSAPNFDQETAFQQFGPYFPSDLNAPLDRVAVRDQFLKAKIDALFDDDWFLPSSRAGKFLAWDADGNPVRSTGTGADAGLRADLAAWNGPTLLGAGNAPGILTSLDDVLQHVNAQSYFGIPDSGSGAGEKFQDVIDELSELASGSTGDRGAVLRMRPYAQLDYEVDPADADYNEGIKIRPRVAVDLQGSRCARRMHGDSERGFILMSHASIRNGRVDGYSEFVSVNGSSLGTQSGVHGTIGIGAIYGSGGTVASPSEFEGAHNWVIENLSLTADKDQTFTVDSVEQHGGAALIQGYGGVHAGTVRNIFAPPSDKAYVVVSFDWAFLTTEVFSTHPSAFAANRVEWEAGRLLTTHPYGISIEEIYAEDLTRVNTGSVVTGTGSMLIRMSGCQGMSVRNASAGRTTAALVALTAGDPGFEFADQAARQIGMDGSMFWNVVGRQPQHGYLGYFDSLGDNLYRAINPGVDDEWEPYDAISDPFIYAGLTIDGLRGYTDRGADALDGIRAIQLWGADIKNSAAFGFRKGILVDESTREVFVHHNKAMYSREDNIYIGHGAFPPEDCEIFANTIARAGRGGGNHAGIMHINSKRTKIFDNTLGVEGAFDDSTVWNIRLDQGESIQGWGNKHHSTGVTGIAESLFTSDEFGKLDRWDIGDMLDPAFIATSYSGTSILPVRRKTDPDLVRRGRYRADRAALSSDTTPSAGTWLKGEVIEYWELAADGWAGVVCVTSGTLGTLSSVTGSITSGTNLLTVSSAAALAVGQYITIAGVSGIKKITAINALVVTIDSNADATVSGAAVAFSAAVFKRFGRIEA